jgi:c-di-GMP-binding flagellar brake protein YcgR
MRVWTNTSFRALDMLAAPAEDAVRPIDGPPTSLARPLVVDVGTVLEEARAARAACVLARTDPGTRPLPIDTIVEGLAPDAILIGRPTYRPGQRSLTVGESLAVRIATADGVAIGESRVVAKFEARPDAPAYAIARPTTLLLEDRRSTDRVGIAREEAPIADVLQAPTHKPLCKGALVDLALGGVRIRTQAAGNGQPEIRSGDRVLVRATLRDDVRMHALGVVVHAGRRADGCVDVGVRFTSEVPDVDRFLRDVAARGTARRHG